MQMTNIVGWCERQRQSRSEQTQQNRAFRTEIEMSSTNTPRFGTSDEQSTERNDPRQHVNRRNEQARRLEHGETDSLCTRCERAVTDGRLTDPWAVDRVVAALGRRGLDIDPCLELRRGGEFLLDLALEAGIGTEVSQVTLAAAAVYAADLLYGEHVVTGAAVAAAAAETGQTSKGAVTTYADAIVQQYGERYGRKELPRAMQEQLA